MQVLSIHDHLLVVALCQCSAMCVMCGWKFLESLRPTTMNVINSFDVPDNVSCVERGMLQLVVCWLNEWAVGRLLSYD